MKALKSILAFALGLVCTVALAQDSLKEVVASGNKVYVRIVNDQEHPIPADEIEDVARRRGLRGRFHPQRGGQKEGGLQQPPHLAHPFRCGQGQQRALERRHLQGRCHHVQRLPRHQHLHQEGHRKGLPGEPVQEGREVILLLARLPGPAVESPTV